LCNTYVKPKFDENSELKDNAMLRHSPHLFDEWDFEKNTELGLDIYKVTKGTGVKAWWIGECGHKWEASIVNRVKGTGCPYCSGNRVLKGFNDMWTTNPELASLLANPEDGFKYTENSHQKIDFKCSGCDSLIKNKILKNVKKQGLSCPLCSNGISYPERLLANILSQLQVEFETQVTPFSRKVRYDFYLPKYNMIIEVHGGQHYVQSGFKSCGGRTLEEEQENDRFKELLAKENGIEDYIVIDCRESTFEYILSSIKKTKLKEIFDLNRIDIKICQEKTSKSIVLETCNKWSNGDSIETIVEDLRVCRDTARAYLIRGWEAGLCDYNLEKEIANNRKRAGYQSGKKRRKAIVQLSINGNYINTWCSAIDIYKDLKINNGQINSCCKKKHGYETAGGYKWMYKEDYDKYIEDQKQLA